MNRKNSPQVAVIYVNWKRYTDTIASIASVKSGSLLPSHIVVVDNHSGNDSIQQIKRAFRDVECISASDNNGYGAGNNIGLDFLNTLPLDYIWLLNPDTIVDKHALRNLVAVFTAQPNTGVAGSRLILEDGTLQAYGGGSINWLLGISRHSTSPNSSLDYISGASMLIRADIARDIRFDTRFFMYWEDVDLSLRIKALGLQLNVAQDSVIHHKESISLGKRSSKMDYLFTESSIIFFKKHSKISLAPILFSTSRRLAARLLKLKFDNVRHIVRALKNT